MEVSRDIRRTYLQNLVGRFPSLVWNSLCSGALLLLHFLLPKSISVQNAERKHSCKWVSLTCKDYACFVVKPSS